MPDGLARDFAGRQRPANDQFGKRGRHLTVYLTHRPSAGLKLVAPTATQRGPLVVDDRYRPFADLVQERLSIERHLTVLGGNGKVPVPDAETARRRWQDAVTMQAVLSRQSEAAADRVVTSMLNQMTRLARFAPWWESQAEAAIGETVEYANGNRAVASAAAQRAWDTYWSLCSLLKQMASPDPGELSDEELQALPDRVTEAEAKWRAAWELWHAKQS